MLEKHPSKITTDHTVIKQLVQQKQGFPVRIKPAFIGHHLPTIGIAYPESANSIAFEKISWEEFFEYFDAHSLAFLYREQVKEEASHHSHASASFYMD